MSQEEQVLRYLYEHGSITPADAFREFGIMRLGARIWDLKAAGVPIKTEREKGKNMFGNTVYYARYILED